MVDLFSVQRARNWRIPILCAAGGKVSRPNLGSIYFLPHGQSTSITRVIGRMLTYLQPCWEALDMGCLWQVVCISGPAI